jgi:spermidine synthase
VTRKLNALLILLFIGSGCAALIYEVVWLQMLQLIVGSTAVSMAVLLGAFMGGMCLGSLALARFAAPARNPLRVYAALEIATACCGIAILFGLPFVASSLACAALLLPPTILMGATLPAISRCVRQSSLGYLYAANIAGGVLGCLAAGFWLLRVFDMGIATYVATAVNVSVAAIALLAADSIPAMPPAQSITPATRDLAVYLAIALSGLSALGAEVVWTRLLSLTLGPTVYTFSIIIAVFLIGMGLGSAAGTRIEARARICLGASQLLLIPAIAWAGYMIAQQLPYWDKNLSVHADPWSGFLFDFACCTAALLPATLLWGASFPLALTVAARGGRDSARPVGEIYAANTIGAIAGAVAFSLFAVPLIGSQNAERALIATAALATLALFIRQVKLTTVAVAAALICAWLIPPVPWQLLAWGRRMPLEAGRTGNGWKRLYSAEGVNSAIAYTLWVDKTRYFHVAGKVEASSTPSDMKLQRVLGHLPALLHPNPRSILIVGCGAGVTAGSFVVHPEVGRITLCEIEPLIPPASARFFSAENHNVVHDPRTHIVYDDARHFVLKSHEKFDIVTSDPIHPWVKGAATLYSKEYFEACRTHLNPGGLVTQWVPLYDSDLATVQSEIATFLEVFPDGIVWGNLTDMNQGYDVVLMGSTEPIHIDIDAVQTRLDRSPRLAASLREVGFHSAAELLGIYAAQGRDLRGWLAHAEINRDRGLRLQYLAGLALNHAGAPSIYVEIESRGAFPEDIFRGSPAQMDELRKDFQAWRTNPF